MALHEIKVVTEDGETVLFDCGPDEDVITAGLRQDVILMSSCREGGCATCKSLCADGEYELHNCSVQALPPEEEEEGLVLLCRTFPRSDLVLEVPYTSDRIAHGSPRRTYRAEVVGLVPVAANAVQFTLRRQADEEAGTGTDFDPGQYLELQIPGTDHWRSFSPANLPNADGVLEFLIRLLPDGMFSNYLRNEARPGQVVNVRGPQGTFHIRENGLRPRYFVAGGTGLAPVVSMVRQMADRGDPHEARLYFGVNREEEVFYERELNALSEGMANLTVRVCVWHAGPNWGGVAGNAVEVLRADLEASGAKPDLYLCGPPGMIDATYKTCLALGIPKEYIFTEKFLASGASGEGPPAVQGQGRRSDGDASVESRTCA